MKKDPPPCMLCSIAPLLDHLSMKQQIIPPASAVQGIKSVRSVCVCVFVCQHSHWWTVWHMDPKLEMLTLTTSRIRSKIKVARMKNMIFEVWDWFTYTDSLCHMMPCNITVWHHDVMTDMRSNLTSSGKKTYKEGRDNARRFHWKMV